MDLQRLAVETPTRAPGGTVNAYVLGSEDALVIDPGAYTDALADLLAERTVGHVAVTHHHPDHAGGVEAVADRHGATVWARAGRTDGFERAAGVAADRTFRPDAAMRSGASPSPADPPTDADQSTGTDPPTAVETAEGPVGVLDAPGHAPEHVAFVHGNDLLTGDLAVAEGSVVVGAPEGDMRAYLSSLRRVHARDPDRLYPGHGPVVEDPRATCARLIAHRLDRERRVFRAVADGAATVEAICERAYEKDLTGVADLAAMTVRAHLEKLAVEKRVRWDGARARPAE